MDAENYRDRDFLSEINFSATRSSGPGGQNVNKVSSKVELRFNIPGSMVLTDAEKEVLLTRLRNRVTSAGDLIIVCQTERSQQKNKEKVLEKFYSLLEKAFKPRKNRVKTAPSRSSIEKRIERKKIQSEKKSRRRDNDLPDEGAF